jgi:hypothetical protein
LARSIASDKNTSACCASAPTTSKPNRTGVPGKQARQKQNTQRAVRPRKSPTPPCYRINLCIVWRCFLLQSCIMHRSRLWLLGAARHAHSTAATSHSHEHIYKTISIATQEYVLPATLPACHLPPCCKQRAPELPCLTYILLRGLKRSQSEGLALCSGAPCSPAPPRYMHSLPQPANTQHNPACPIWNVAGCGPLDHCLDKQCVSHIGGWAAGSLGSGSGQVGALPACLAAVPRALFVGCSCRVIYRFLRAVPCSVITPPT